jgi:hypothetical protein
MGRRKNAYKELMKVKGWFKRDQPLGYPAVEHVELSLKPKYEFKVGKIYQIQTKPCEGKRGYESEWIFKYEGKSGKHHKFKEVRGRWSRTYTDNQLIGKEIKEVNL